MSLVPNYHSFGFYINGGLDRLRFESTYTETLKAMHHLLHVQMGDDEKAFKLLHETMERQLASRNSQT